jgi:hypothetical protein
MPAALIIPTGTRFARLTVLEEIQAVNFDNRKGSPNRRFRLQCECGNTVDSDLHSLRSGYRKSCGCLHIEAAIDNCLSRTKHGFARRGKYHPLYKVWSTMKERCSSPKNWKYKDYGARGIFVCDEWKDDPEAFITWALANGWAKGLLLDREDNDGPYAPWNCRFVTPTISANNQRPRKPRDPEAASRPERAAKLQEVGLARYGKRWKRKLARDLGVAPVTLRYWAQGIYGPPADILFRLEV